MGPDEAPIESTLSLMRGLGVQSKRKTATPVCLYVGLVEAISGRALPSPAATMHATMNSISK